MFVKKVLLMLSVSTLLISCGEKNEFSQGDSENKLESSSTTTLSSVSGHILGEPNCESDGNELSFNLSRGDSDQQLQSNYEFVGYKVCLDTNENLDPITICLPVQKIINYFNQGWSIRYGGCK